MELRKKVKRPQRYEPEPDTHLQETYVSPVLSPIFPTTFVDFNPDLPPAAFPTYDQPRVADLSGYRLTSVGRAVATPLGPAAPTDQQLPRGDAKELFESPDTWHNVWQASDGPQSEVLVDNLRVLRRTVDKSQEGWIIQGVETSDEEEQFDRGPSRAVHRGERRPLWKDLPKVLQLTIVDALSRHLTVEEVGQRLGLTVAQQREVLKHQAHRRRLRALEDSIIKSMHAEQMDLFLSGIYSSSRAITQTVFHESIEKHLYKNLGDVDHHTVTKKELVDAQTFLKAIGLDPDLTGDWSDWSENQGPSKVRPCEQLAQLGSRSSNMYQRARSAPEDVKASPHQNPAQLAPMMMRPSPAFRNTNSRANPSIPVKRVVFGDRARLFLNTGSKPEAAYPVSRLDSARDHSIPSFDDSSQHCQQKLKAGLSNNDAHPGRTLSKQFLVSARADAEHEAIHASADLGTLRKSRGQLREVAESHGKGDGRGIMELGTSSQLAASMLSHNGTPQSSSGGENMIGMEHSPVFGRPPAGTTVLFKRKSLVGSSSTTPCNATPEEPTIRERDFKANGKDNEGTQNSTTITFGASSGIPASVVLPKVSSDIGFEGTVQGVWKPGLAQNRQISTSTSMVSSRSEHKRIDTKRADSKLVKSKLSISEALTTEKGQYLDQSTVESMQSNVEEKKPVKKRSKQIEISRKEPAFAQDKAVVRGPRSRKALWLTTAGQPSTASK